MGKYEALTKYLPMLDTINSSEVRKFTSEVYSFIDTHSEYDLNNYIEILKENNIEWEMTSMQSVDVSSLDDKAVLALLVGAVRAERFCDGAMCSFIKNGQINKWLTKLKEIDKT